jgi:hypothetical protein
VFFTSHDIPSWTATAKLIARKATEAESQVYRDAGREAQASDGVANLLVASDGSGPSNEHRQTADFDGTSARFEKSIPFWGVSAHHPIDRASRVRLDRKPMKTSAQYLALSQHYRIAKLSTRDAAVRDQLEIFERSYFILSQSAQILVRSKAFRMRLFPHPRRTVNPSRSAGWSRSG